MKTVGIICEYDPFHAGHEFLIRRVREAGAERVLCLMSGDTVQRGTPAILPKEYRARAAAASGADAVFELPFPWCSASAEVFAAAGVYTLWKLGADTIAFGSECADLARLTDAARAAIRLKEAGDFSPRDAAGTAESYFEALGGDAPGPNDILGIEYVKAALTLHAPLEFYPVRRIGAAHGSADASASYPSATALRAQIDAGETPRGLPAAMADELAAARAAGDCPVRGEALSAACVAFWRLTDPERAALFAECGGGVSGRLHAAALASGSLPELLAAAATKKYTSARLRRAVLFAMTGVTPDDLRARPAFVPLLAAGEGGRAYLAETRRARGIPVVTKPALRPADSPGAIRQGTLSDARDALITLARPRPCAASVPLTGGRK